MTNSPQRTDVGLPVEGIVDVLDNAAFVRADGYLPGPDDVFIPLAQLRKLGLRRGDVSVGLGDGLIRLDYVIRVGHVHFLSRRLHTDGSSKFGLRHDTLCHG